MLEELIKPWKKSEIKFRVGSANKDKTMALPLAYVDARAVMDRLDKVMGPTHWQDRYEFHGDRTVCYLSLRIDGEWLTKADGAGDSDIEGAKGGISDAFKRAAVKWGMGRELYEMKCRWMPMDQYKQLQGDPWEYIIGNKTKGAPKPKDQPVFNVEVQFNIAMTAIKNSLTREILLQYWNSAEAKRVRQVIRGRRPEYYAELAAKTNERLMEFSDD